MHQKGRPKGLPLFLASYSPRSIHARNYTPTRPRFVVRSKRPIWTSCTDVLSSNPSIIWNLLPVKRVGHVRPAVVWCIVVFYCYRYLLFHVKTNFLENPVNISVRNTCKFLRWNNRHYLLCRNHANRERRVLFSS